jgi:2-methylcitrate dehydratase PrpD
VAGETRALADFATALRYEDIPSSVIAITKACIIDTVAVALFGVQQRTKLDVRLTSVMPSMATEVDIAQSLLDTDTSAPECIELRAVRAAALNGALWLLPAPLD